MRRDEYNDNKEHSNTCTSPLIIQVMRLCHNNYDFVRENQKAENYSEIDVTLQVEITVVDSESAYLQT